MALFEHCTVVIPICLKTVTLGDFKMKMLFTLRFFKLHWVTQVQVFFHETPSFSAFMNGIKDTIKYH